MTYEEFKGQIYEAGIIGAGGAGFPSHIKLDKDMDYLVINGAECEPLIYTDNEIMTKYSEEIITIIRDMLNILHIKKAVWGVKSKHKELIIKLEALTSQDNNIEICSLDNIYPAGDELTLIHKCTGIVIPKGQLPSSKKIIELNVETLFNIYQCIYNKKPVVHKYVTVSGCVKTTKVYTVPVGTPIKELIQLAQPTIEAYDILLGGPMMGRFVSEDTKVTRTTKAVILLPKDSLLYTYKKGADLNTIKRVMASCSQCQMCTDLCPRNRLGHKVEPHKLMNAFANNLLQNTDQMQTALGCCGCNTCSYYACHHQLNPGELMMMVKRELMKNGFRPEPNQQDLPIGNPYVQVPSTRLLEKLGLKPYETHASLEETPLNTQIVYIPLGAHIGAKATPIVKLGDSVEENQKIAIGTEKGISANVHSSIKGIVKEITQTEIIIERR